MKTRFIIGSSEIDVHTYYYIYDQVKKETLFYPYLAPSGKMKPVQVLQKELTDYCALLNKQDAEGEFTTDTATLTKKAADYIAYHLSNRKTLCENLLQRCYSDTKQKDYRIESLQDELDTIDSIFKAISPIRFPMSVLRAPHSPNNH